MDDSIRIAFALDIAARYGGIEGDNHLAWVIDQMVRALTGGGDSYKHWVAEFESGDEGPKTYRWSRGVAP